MSELSDLRLKDQLFVRTYPWRRIDPVPWTPLSKPLSECRLGLISSAGLSPPEEEPFDLEFRGGDPSFRVIRSDIDVAQLIDHHRSRSWDHSGVEKDRNLAFPIDRIRELVESGRIGSISEHFLSFMGSITAPGRLRRDHLPRAAEILVAEGVEVALLVPV